MPVTARMIRREDMCVVHLEKEPLETLRLVELADRFDRERLTRMPAVTEDWQLRLVIHRSMLDKFIASVARREDRAGKVGDLTVAQLMNELPGAKQQFESGFAVVAERARLADAKKLTANADCHDIFVTATGSPDEPLLGWLTNEIISESL
jgi:hypothetical protein